MKTLLSLAGSLLLFILLMTSRAGAQWTNGQNADLVLGQKDFTSSDFGVGADSLYAPTDVAIDPLTRKLFVADIVNNRVLRWRSVDSLISGEPAEAVFGQPDMESNATAAAADRLDFPTAIAFDQAGRLWVADADNNRVLRFDSAGYKPSSPAADAVLGQPNFTSSAAGLSRVSMNYVRGIATDNAGRIWVADQSNNRVLRFDNAAAKANGANADGVLGQPDFTTFRDTITANSFRVPRGLVVDPQGRLYVADSWNNRVLRFDNAASKPNGADADAVLGQTDFTTANFNTSQSGMGNPWGVELDPSGRLYVTENLNNRLLWFNNAAAKANGSDADGVLGQPDFTSDTVKATQNSMYSAWGSYADPAANKLWVADAGNNRVLRFSASGPLSGVLRSMAIPGSYSLEQNYPNPFNPATTIRYTLAVTSHVSLIVYDVLGREVATLVNTEKPAGSYSVRFDASGLASGVYLIRLKANEFVGTEKAIVLK